jgi:hypothetical protein
MTDNQLGLVMLWREHLAYMSFLNWKTGVCLYLFSYLFGMHLHPKE